jgi:hypothetical protein
MFEAEATARRASLPTVPETEARKQVSSSAGDCMLDQPKLTWAVDLGHEVRALSTFDLWYALSAGDLAGDVKVWRVGREAWTSALEVPELACALAAIAALIPARQTLDYVAHPPSFGSESLARPVSSIETAAAAQEAREPAIEMIAERDSHEEVFEHELEEAIEWPEEGAAAQLRSDELTPSADLPLGQVISLHPSAEPSPLSPARKRAIAALFAAAATRAVGCSFLVAFAAPSVGAEASNAALLPSDRETSHAPAAAPLFDMEAEAALAEASSHRIAERLSRELEAAPAEVVRRVKSWSPSEKGQKRTRAAGKPSAKKTVKKPAFKPSNSFQKRR